MRGPCEASFRWEDEPGYQPTRDPRGAFIPDAAGRRPGIYTYLSGSLTAGRRPRSTSTCGRTRQPPLAAGPFDPRRRCSTAFRRSSTGPSPARARPAGTDRDSPTATSARSGCSTRRQAEALRSDRHAPGGAPDHDRGYRQGRQSRIRRRSCPGTSRLGRGRPPAREPGADALLEGWVGRLVDPRGAARAAARGQPPCSNGSNQGRTRPCCGLCHVAVTRLRHCPIPDGQVRTVPNAAGGFAGPAGSCYSAATGVTAPTDPHPWLLQLETPAPAPGGSRGATQDARRTEPTSRH